ncbi:MAG TPA: succinate dehydrogenase [Alphaproteobacteria bacterium]|jgi:fumarate reductase subunit D|nr:succinate dehydrogenase [Alphaproteobacteria bacterium]HJM49847.1 succinate dehydrogenase [Alphaproteobacteria bacterium]|tara:strand:- start:1228 stop:1563 length:336 start_codon:yes stop_codon:yes gene_type:complete
MSARNHPAYWAFVVHRVSGLALAAFVPLHLYVLSLALEQTATLDRFLAWSTAPLVKLAETALVVLLAVHLAGGIRLLALEFLPGPRGQTPLIALAGGVALAAGLFFLLNAA